MPDESATPVAPEDERRRDRTWLMWLVLALLLLVVLWFLRDYLMRGRDASLVGTATTSSQAPVRRALPEAVVEEAAEEPEVRGGVTVPDVVGLMTSVAINKLRGEGYEASVTNIYSDDKPRGVVFEQVPAAGTPAEPGSTVRILVSQGSKPLANVRLPDFTGMKKAAAVNKAKSLGLDPKIMVQPRQNGAGRVYEQQPVAGTKVAGGSKVFLLVTVKN